MTLLQCGAGDRPVEITLERMWAALSWRKRAAFLRALVAGGAPPGGAPSAAGAAGADDAVAAVIAQLSASFPEVGLLVGGSVVPSPRGFFCARSWRADA